MADFQYIGSELDVFAHAQNWKHYWGTYVRDYLQGDVLEVGAGIGANTLLLCDSHQRRWVCLEPDNKLVTRLRASLERAGLDRCEVIYGALRSISKGEEFDAILYIDVLEHIEDDAGELAEAAQHLRVGGVIVVLAPAYQALFSKFDSAIGHFRRYSKSSLALRMPGSLQLERLIYMDSVGLLASLGNRFLLKQPRPSLRQIAMWDKTMVPISRWIDRLAFHSVGKSILGIWRRRK